MRDSDISYKTIPPLAAYIDRIGAEQLNFRRFMIKERHGTYYTERVLIRIEDDGTIKATHKEYAPTKDEVDLIRAALSALNFPRSIRATRAQLTLLKAKLRNGSETYEFLGSDGNIAMVQERVNIGGVKTYLPWTFFSDGEWRMMEPDGKLPFWKPSHIADKKRICIHEGAKAAKAVNDMLANGAEHPWKEWLSNYTHWGMIGGALAPHRSDYDEIRRQQPLEVVYVCDNDPPGAGALEQVSRQYCGTMKGIRFDHRWPEGWDMADEMPKQFFGKDGRYKGPQIETELLKLATWATESVITKNNPRPVIQITPKFREEWYHAVSPEVFVHRDWPNRILSTEEFNSIVRPFSDADNTARILKKSDQSKSCVLKYSPAEKPGIINSKQGTYINTHVPSEVKEEKADPGLWLEFIEHLIPEEKDRTEVLRWIATLVARPDIKMHYSLLLISETQGVGKGTLCEKILAPLMGEDNVSYPSEDKIVNSNFNSWQAHKRLAVVHEIYAGHSSKAYNKLKSIVTDDRIEVNKKYIGEYTIANWLHIAACSNSPGALKLSMEDRRWLVPKVTEKKKPTEFWIRFNEWLIDENGLGIISHWCKEFLKKHNPVMTGEPAPWTVSKRDIVEEGYSDGMKFVAETLRRLKSIIDGEYPEKLEDLVQGRMIKGGEAFIRDVDMMMLLKSEFYNGHNHGFIERPLTIRRMAKDEGWWISPGRTKVKSWGPDMVRLICSSKDLSERSVKEICSEEMKEEDKWMPVGVEELRKISKF